MDVIHPDVATLQTQLQGRVIGPGDEGYDEARTVFYGGEDRRPTAIARVANSDDVARVITFARESEIELAVRSGGHSVARHSVVDGGIVLDLGDMKGIVIDAEGHTAWGETGLTAGEYTTATGAHGLATGFGDTGSVGIGGITLGGGIGYLVRKYGLTVDDLLAAEVVTADGTTLEGDADSHPDLFWAIRGRGRELRGGDPFQVPLARGRPCLRRHALHAGVRGCDRGSGRGDDGGSRRALGDGERDEGPTDAVHPRGVSRPA